ncbi:MAG: ATP-binding protein [Anaerolineales bacterium]|nr:ATP-binding protein [Anaerolineales bacterium]
MTDTLSTTPTEKPARRAVPGVGDPDCPHCHGLGYLRPERDLSDPDFGKVQVCACRLPHLQLLQAQQLRADSNIESLAGKTFENFLPEGVSPDPYIRATVRAAYERCKAFAEKPENWLLLTGGYGCGKTHLAAAIANQALANGQPALFLNTPDLLDFLRETFAPNSDTTYSDRFEEIRTAPLLILDDLGTESPTPWAVEKLYQLLNFRYNAHLPTVVTTNKRVEDLEGRIASRLSDAEMVTVLNVLAPDFRAGKLSASADISTLALHRHQTFETFDLRPELTGDDRQRFLNAVRAAQEFADEPRGWLVFVGPYASGKTHLAAAIANQRALAGRPVIFVTYADLMELFRSGSREQEERNTKALQHIRNVELLVIDDISPQLTTVGYYRERFFQVFNHRFDAQLPTVLTTAADEKELDPRIKSRIFLSDYCQVHVLRVEPYRGKRKSARRK